MREIIAHGLPVCRLVLLPQLQSALGIGCADGGDGLGRGHAPIGAGDLELRSRVAFGARLTRAPDLAQWRRLRWRRVERDAAVVDVR